MHGHDEGLSGGFTGGNVHAPEGLSTVEPLPVMTGECVGPVLDDATIGGDEVRPSACRVVEVMSKPFSVDDFVV